MRRTSIALLFVLTAPLAAQQEPRGKDMRGENLVRAQMANADLSGANLEGVDLTSAYLYHANLRGANLKGANLTQTSLGDADLTGADLRDAKFSVTMLSGANLTQANLSGSDLSGAILSQAVLKDANLAGTRGIQDVTRCDFSGADLTGADMAAAKDWQGGSAKFAGARYDARTRWPEGVVPDRVGAVLVEAPPDPPPAAKDPVTPPPAATDPQPAAKDPDPAAKDPQPAAKDPAARAVGSGRDFHERRLTKANLKALDLQAANFEDALLYGCDFSKMDLRRANFRGADLSQVSFMEADLSGADLRDVKLSATLFHQAKLAGAILEGTDLTQGTFRENSFRGADLSRSRGLQDITGSDFSGADLTGAHLKGARDWSGSSARFQDARYDRKTLWPDGLVPDVSGAVLVETPPRKAEAPEPDVDAVAAGGGEDYKGKNLRGRKLDGQDLTGADFRDAILIGVDFTGATLARADLRGADLTEARLYDADLYGADLRGANLKGARIEGARFTRANLEGVDLGIVFDNSKDMIFRRANLKGVKGLPSLGFGGCDLRGADLRGARMVGPSMDRLQSCRWRGAKFDDSTSFPGGLDAEGLGAVRCEAVAQGPDGGTSGGVVPPPKLLSPKRDPNAPTEGTVKKLFELAWVWRQLGKTPTAEEEGQLPKGGGRFSFEYRSLAYGPVREIQVGGAPTRAWPVTIQGTATEDATNGQVTTTTLKAEVFFYRDDKGAWKLNPW